MPRHPLLDRRDLTAQRNAPPPPAPDLSGVAGALLDTNDLLRGILTAQRADLDQLCVTDREPPESRMENFPVPGACRYIVRRTGAGGLLALTAGVPRLVVPANENRLGGLLVNAGAGAVTLFLAADLLTPGSANPLPEGAAQILLNAGGSWDFLLGRVLWSGNVVAVAAADSSVSVAEV